MASTVGNLAAAAGASGDHRRWSRRVAADLVGFADALAVTLGALTPAVIYSLAGGLAINWPRYLQVCLITSVLAYGFLKSYGMYDTTRMHDFPVRPLRLAASLVFANLAILGLGLPFAPGDVHMWVWHTVAVALGFLALAHTRLLARHVLAQLTRTGRFDARVAVYGSGAIALRVRDFLADPSLAITFAGVFDDRTDTARQPGDGPALAGRLDDLIARSRAGEIDRIIIALPQSADRRTELIAGRLAHLPVSLHVVTHIASDLIDDTVLHRVSQLGPIGLIDIKPKPLYGWGRVVKAVEDRVLAAIFLLLALPVLAAAALAIKLDSAGPVLFRQRRAGRNGRVIEVLKFRTMHVLEDGEAIPQARRNDPRVTRVGGFLRRFSIDELPQLINVLKGDMSLVGPRPHALAHDQRFAEIIARYPMRQQVNPGITGLAQVEGWRGEIETPEMLTKRLEKDLEYVNRWSLWLDLSILLRTPFSCLANRAY